MSIRLSSATKKLLWSNILCHIVNSFVVLVKIVPTYLVGLRSTALIARFMILNLFQGVISV